MSNSSKTLYLFTDKDEVFYFSGFSVDDAVLVTDGLAVTLITDDRYYQAALKFLSPKGISVVNGGGLDAAMDIIKKQSVVSLGVNFSEINVKTFKKLESLGIEIFDAKSFYESKASHKTVEEIKLMQTAAEIAERAYSETLFLIEEGVSEIEIAGELEYRFKKYGASKPSFDTIVAFGENSAIPHHETGLTRLKKGSVVLLDFGCCYGGYASDMTRTVFFGIPDDEYVQNYLAVLNAHKLAFQNIHAGMTGVEADSIARNYLKTKGLDKYFTHSLGHGVGVKIHESPYLSPKNNNVLCDGAVFSIEPGVYLNGKYGIRIEDTVCLKNGKVESLMSVSKDLTIIG